MIVSHLPSAAFLPPSMHCLTTAICPDILVTISHHSANSKVKALTDLILGKDWVSHGRWGKGTPGFSFHRITDPAYEDPAIMTSSH